VRINVLINYSASTLLALLVMYEILQTVMNTSHPVPSLFHS